MLHSWHKVMERRLSVGFAWFTHFRKSTFFSSFCSWCLSCRTISFRRRGAKKTPVEIYDSLHSRQTPINRRSTSLACVGEQESVHLGTLSHTSGRRCAAAALTSTGYRSFGRDSHHHWCTNGAHIWTINGGQQAQIRGRFGGSA